MHPTLTDKHQQIVELCIQYRILKLEVFGSVTTKAFNDQSDIDFLVEFERKNDINAFEQYFDFKAKLENLFSRTVDLISYKAIRNPYFRSEVNQSKHLLYAA